MTTLHTHPHAAFDRFPQLVRDLTVEFGTDGIDAVVEHFIEAERADFHWDGRIAEMNLGAWESLDEEHEAFELVAGIAYFRSRHYVATGVVDRARHVPGLPRRRPLESFESGEKASRSAGG